MTLDDKKILILDDHLISGLGTKALLNSLKIPFLIFNANTRVEAEEILGSEQIDLILLDIVMPDGDSFEFLSFIKEQYPNIKVVMLTISEEKLHVYSAMKNKADGYFFKDINKEELFIYLRYVFNGKKAYQSRVIDIVMEDLRTFYEKPSLAQYHRLDPRSHPGFISKFEKLTKKERMILNLIGKGMSTKEIAHKLELSQFTINTHRKNIHSKLELVNHSSLSNIAKEYLDS
jgi:DNA-binding NarL/FixJ family response regulator